MALKAQKELEQRVHDEFYQTVKVLTQLHPPPQEFLELFNNHMFLKNNKAGFHQVVHYLLDILDHDKLTQVVPSWPVYSVQLEAQFRSQILKYINELNSQYEDANIPQVQASQLISPGGFKFIKFICKLSRFVLFEQASKKVPPGLLLPLKSCKCEAVTVENLRKLNMITEKINRKTNGIINGFEKKFKEAQMEASKITHDQQETTKVFKESQERLELLRKKLDEDYPDLHVKEASNLLSAQQKLHALSHLKEKFEECESVDSALRSADARVTQAKELQIPAEISQLVRYVGDDLDLSSLLEGCIALVDRTRLEVKPMTDNELCEQIGRFGRLNEKFALINEDLVENEAELMKLAEQLQRQSVEKAHKRKPLQVLQLVERGENDSDSTNSVLAEPLPLSPAASVGSSGHFSLV